MATACQSEMKEMPKTSDDINDATLSSTVAALSSTAVAVSSTAAPLSSTSLQDLPIEVLDDILMKAVMKKVMDKKLAKAAWVEFASRVVKQLRTVSLQWNHSLTTNWFEIVLHRKLNNCKDPMAISVELITTCHCDSDFLEFGWLNNQIYLIDSYPPDRYCNSDDCDDSVLHIFEGRDTTRHIKEIILPSVKGVRGMAACKWSNSIYVWRTDPTAWRSGPTVWHLVPDGEGGFEVLQWPTFPPDFLDCSTISKIAVEHLSVLDGGNLLVLRRVFYGDDEGDNVLSVHKPDGVVIRNVTLSHDAVLSNVAIKSNGNFVYCQLIYDDNNSYECIIREVDEDGKEIRNFHFLDECCYHDCKQLFLDAYDRVIFHHGNNGLIFLDCELNFLKEIENLDVNESLELVHAEFDKETSEMIVVTCFLDFLFLKLTL